MKFNRILNTLVFLLIACVFGSSRAQEHIIVANPSYKLTTVEIDLLAEKAYAGDAGAALRISDHFTYQPSEKKRKKNLPSALAWALIGAENGGAESQFRAYEILSASDDKRMQVRALFWLQQAAKNGDKKAIAILKVCQTIDAKYPSGDDCFGPESDL